jgi:hypothetical protein
MIGLIARFWTSPIGRIQELALTEDGVKKRWRSIYRAAERAKAGLSAGRACADLRRAPLQRSRLHLVELRPYT